MTEILFNEGKEGERASKPTTIIYLSSFGFK